MSPLRRIDGFLLARVFQPVVDLSLRQPVWWARQCAVAYVVLQLVSGLLWGWGWTLVLALLVFPVFAWLVTATPARSAAFGADWRFRGFVLCLVLVQMALLVLVLVLAGSVGGLQVLGCLSGFAFTAMVYFCACSPPRPRVPRARLAAGLT